MYWPALSIQCNSCNISGCLTCAPCTATYCRVLQGEEDAPVLTASLGSPDIQAKVSLFKCVAVFRSTPGGDQQPLHHLMSKFYQLSVTGRKGWLRHLTAAPAGWRMRCCANQACSFFCWLALHGTSSHLVNMLLCCPAGQAVTYICNWSACLLFNVPVDQLVTCDRARLHAVLCLRLCLCLCLCLCLSHCLTV
jgi:hypothetical protein